MEDIVMPAVARRSGHAKRSLTILTVGVLLFVIFTTAAAPLDRGPLAVLYGSVILAPTLLLVLLLNKGDRDAVQRARFSAATITGQIWASTGYGIPAGRPVLLAVRADAVTFDFGEGRGVRIPLSQVLAVEFGGPGTQLTSGAIIGAAIDVGPVIIGSASASTRTSTNTFVHVSTTEGAFTVHTQEADPTELEVVFAEALLILRQRSHLAARPEGAASVSANTRIDGLERLAALRGSGALSETEYAREKARLPGS